MEECLPNFTFSSSGTTSISKSLSTAEVGSLEVSVVGDSVEVSSLRTGAALTVDSSDTFSSGSCLLQPIAVRIKMAK